MTLGAMGMAPLEVAQIYQTLVADGFYSPLLSINAVLDTDGKLLKSYPLKLSNVSMKRFCINYVMLC
ncbi:hypothetical protein ACLKMH_18725 [Psychromonas sp. KJ10-10]|uniref:hypothetical protein n=1 Tax=Psychromonas sp. KJ10-10 TaxID=3391823 RepID=UPI0039B3DE37